MYTKIFQVLHSDIPALLLNQEIKFLSESEHPLRQVEHTDTVLNRTRSKKSADNILTIAEIHKLQSYWNKYGEQLSSDFDILYASDQCDSCNQKHRGEEIYKCLTQRTMQSNLRSQYIWQTYFISEENWWVCIQRYPWTISSSQRASNLSCCKYF